MGLLSVIWRRLHKERNGRRIGLRDRRQEMADAPVEQAQERRRGPPDRRRENRRRIAERVDEE